MDEQLQATEMPQPSRLAPTAVPLTEAQVDQVEALLVGRACRPHQEVLRLHVAVHVPAGRAPLSRCRSKLAEIRVRLSQQLKQKLD